MTLPTFGTDAVVPSSDLNTLVAYLKALITAPQRVECSVALTLSTTDADITGCTLTLTPTGASAYALVFGVFDFEKDAAAFTCVGKLQVDGVDEDAQALGGHSGATAFRGTVGQCWVVSLAAGAHTLKLRGAKSAAAGTGTANTQHTTLTAWLVDLP